MTTPRGRATRTVIVLAGQSLNAQPVGSSSFANQLAARFAGLARVVDTSQAGIAWLQWARTDWGHRIQVPLATGARVIVCMCGGTTDYSTTANRTGAQCYADQVTVSAAVKAARAAGVVKVIGSTTHPSTTLTGSNETNRAAGNVLVLADASTAFDAIVDYAVAPELDDPTDTTYYQGDGTHETAAGAAVMVDLVDPLIRALLVPAYVAPAVDVAGPVSKFLIDELGAQLLDEAGGPLLDESLPPAWVPGDPWPGTPGGAGRDGWSPYIRLYLTAAIGAGQPFTIGPGAHDQLDRGNVVAFAGQTVTSTLDVDLTPNLTALHVQGGAPQGAGVFSSPDAAVLEAELYDPTGLYDPLNGRSPYAVDHVQRLRPGVPVTAWTETVDPLTAAVTTLYLFTGTADRWESPWTFDVHDRRATLQATDPTKLFAKMHHPAQTPVGAGDFVSQRVARIVAEYGWTGTVIGPPVWATGHLFSGLPATDMSTTGWAALGALMELEIGFLHFTRTGSLRWLDRTAWTEVAFAHVVLGNPADAANALDIVTGAVPANVDRNLHNSVYAAKSGGTVYHASASASVNDWGEQSLTRTDLGMVDDSDVIAWGQAVVGLEGYPHTGLESVTVQPSLAAQPWTAYTAVLSTGLVTGIVRVWWPAPGEAAVPIDSRLVGFSADISPWTISLDLQLVTANLSTNAPVFTVGPSARDELNAGNVLGF